MSETQSTALRASRAVIGIALSGALALGMAPLVPNQAYADDPATADGSASAEPQGFSSETEATSYDRAVIWAAGVDDASMVEEVYPESREQNLRARAATPSVKPMTFSDEMLYFCKYESSCNYDQGLSSGDGYNAMGYFQFDRRYGLGNCLQAVYNYNPTRYKCLKVIGDKYNWNTNRATRSNGKFTTFGNDLNTAWHAAYKANPTEFSRLQNGWAYTQYYDGPAGVRGSLKAFGINTDYRADCVKGLVWGMSNLFGQGGGASYVNQGLYYGCNWFFKQAKINNSMTDVQLVTALCDTVVSKVASRYPSQPEYHQGWQNRYKKEKADCLEYLKGYRSAWRQIGGYWYWYDASGNRATGWEYIKNKWYYFNSAGVMQTGWEKVSGKWYYLGTSGAMKTGWQEVSGKWYFFSEKGAMQTGWLVRPDEKKYYLQDSGAMLSQGWHVVDGDKYHMSEKGSVEIGWISLSEGRYYLDEDGIMQTGWERVSGKWYYLNKDGIMQTGWEMVSGKWYFLDDEGVMQAGWLVRPSGAKYYLFSSGSMASPGWNKIDGKWYYMGSSGAVKVGWIKLDDKWYYMDRAGVMKKGWLELSGKWYFLDDKGAMKTGWLKRGTKTYYLNSKGVMLTGKQTIDGRIYRFSSSGALL